VKSLPKGLSWFELLPSIYANARSGFCFDSLKCRAVGSISFVGLFNSVSFESVFIWKEMQKDSGSRKI